MSPRDQSRWFAPIAARPNKVNDQTLPIRGATRSDRARFENTFAISCISRRGHWRPRLAQPARKFSISPANSVGFSISGM